MELDNQQEQNAFAAAFPQLAADSEYARGVRDGWTAGRRFSLQTFAARLTGGLAYAAGRIKSLARDAGVAEPQRWNSVLEWDRPGEGLYAEGQIRIIESRREDGRVGACHLATPEEVRWVLLMEQLAVQAPGLAVIPVDAQDAKVAQLRSIAEILLAKYDELRKTRPAAAEFELLRHALNAFDTADTPQ